MLAPLPTDARAVPADFEAVQRRWADAPRGFVATLADAKPRAAAGELSAHYEELAARDGEFETWALQWCHLAAVELWYAVVLPRRAVARGDERNMTPEEEGEEHGRSVRDVGQGGRRGAALRAARRVTRKRRDAC